MPDYDFDYPEGSLDFSPIPYLPDPVYETPLELGPGYIDWENWGGGAGGDGSNGSAGLGGLGGGSSGGFDLLSLLKALGLTTGNNGAAGALLPLLSLLAGGAGLVNQNNNTEDAAKQLQAGADKANALATDLIGGARTDYKPYMDAGTASLGKLQAMVGANNLADKFGAIGQASAMGDKFKGAMTLKQLMGK